MPPPPWRAALALVSRTASNRRRIGRRPGERRGPSNKRRDDRLQPHRPRPRRGLVGARLGTDDQQLHGENIARKAGLACAEQPLGQLGGLALAGVDLAAVGAQDFRPAASPPSARAATAEWQSPPRAARKARSASTASWVGRWSIAASRREDRRVRPGSRRRSRPAPAPAADRAARRRRCRAGRARRRRAGWRRPRRGRSWPAGSGRCRGSARLRGRAAAPAIARVRRGEEVPTRAPSRQRLDAVGADQPVARVGALQHRGDREQCPAGSSRRPSSNGPRGRCGPRRGRRRAPWSTAPCRRPRRAADPG